MGPDFMSLEYLVLYQNNASEKMIALISGIYETQHSADSALAIIKSEEPKALTIKTDMYMGCMH
jgi:hypothetical protein